MPFSKKEVRNFKAVVHVNGICIIWAFSIPKNECKKKLIPKKEIRVRCMQFMRRNRVRFNPNAAIFRRINDHPALHCDRNLS